MGENEAKAWGQWFAVGLLGSWAVCLPIGMVWAFLVDLLATRKGAGPGAIAQSLGAVFGGAIGAGGAAFGVWWQMRRAAQAELAKDAIRYEQFVKEAIEFIMGLLLSYVSLRVWNAAIQPSSQTESVDSPTLSQLETVPIRPTEPHLHLASEIVSGALAHASRHNLALGNVLGLYAESARLHDAWSTLIRERSELIDRPHVVKQMRIDAEFLAGRAEATLRTIAVPDIAFGTDAANRMSGFLRQKWVFDQMTRRIVPAPAIKL
ncbi:MAG: hypothetical protein KIT20_01620 [Alphaproteobacteria bacterium]|nr:hypothetical protein [Alphaproteobacteria bacterium]